MIVEAIGYAASALVAVSLVMVSVLRLRVINLIGAVCFVIYGVAISAIPLVATNGFIVLVNVYHIARILRTKPSSFRYILATADRSAEVTEFIGHYRNDILRYYPEFAVAAVESALRDSSNAVPKVFLAVHNLRVEGIACVLPIEDAQEALSDDRATALLAAAGDRPHTGAVRYLALDYITAQYRDLGLAEHLYESVGCGSEDQTLVCLVDAGAKKSRRFLESNGFTSLTSGGRQNDSTLLALVRTL